VIVRDEAPPPAKLTMSVLATLPSSVQVALLSTTMRLKPV